VLIVSSRHGRFQWLVFVKARGVPDGLPLVKLRDLLLNANRFAQGEDLYSSTMLLSIFKKEYRDEEM
jgi:hypothetical protein